MGQEDIKIDSIKYKNDTNKPENIILSVSAYDSKEQTVLNTKPFLALEESKYSVGANKEIEIPILSSIPEGTPNGTYFNLISIQKKEDKLPTGQVAVSPALGVLVAFHIEDSESTISKIFFDQSDITIKVIKKGIPYLQPAEFEYTYINNSNFIFKPEGEIRILDNNNNQILDRYEINPEKKSVYPGETIQAKYSVNIWKDYKDVLATRNIVSKTFSDIDSTPVLNKVEISILYQTIILGGIAGLVLMSMIFVIVTAISSRKKTTKVQKENEDIKE